MLPMASTRRQARTKGQMTPGRPHNGPDICYFVRDGAERKWFPIKAPGNEPQVPAENSFSVRDTNINCAGTSESGWIDDEVSFSPRSPVSTDEELYNSISF
jgi:hypothetical protein